MPNFDLAFFGSRGRTGDDRPASMDWLRHAQTGTFSRFARTRESSLPGSLLLSFLGSTQRLPQSLAVGLGCSWVLSLGGGQRGVWL
jgi:hypothetical protein